LEKDSSSNIGHHHYASDAQRAQDDLLITEVKSALVDDGISNGYPIEVDADHGTVTLSGVVRNAAGEIRTGWFGPDPLPQDERPSPSTQQPGCMLKAWSMLST